jgi:hypothetical protein
MFCSNCGKEIPEGKAFCTNCGAPAAKEPTAGGAPATPPAPPAPSAATSSQAAEPTSSAQATLVAPPPQPPAAPPTVANAPSPKKHKKWPIIAGIVGVLVVVAVVLVLVLVVFKGSSPTKAVQGFFDAVQKSDSAAAMKVIDPTYFEKNKELEAVFKKEVLGTMPEGVKFTGLEYKTTVNGSTGTVDVTKGTIIYTQDGKKHTVDITKLDGGNKYDMVKVNGTWYISATTFAGVFGKAFKESADTVMKNSLEPMSLEVGDAFSALSKSMSATPTPTAQQMKDQLTQVEAKLKEFKAASEKAKAAYEKIADISGSNVANYKNYATAAIGFIDSSNAVFNESLALLQYVVNVKAEQEAGKTPDMTAYNQKTAEYAQKLADLEKKMTDYQDTMNKIDKTLQ